MSKAVPFLCLLAFISTAATFAADEKVETEEKKKGFLSRMTNIFSKDKKDPPPEEKTPETKKTAPAKSAPTPAKKPASGSPPPKPKLKSATTSSPKSKPAAKPIAKDDQHRHFGAGQTETTLTLPPGKHTLQLLLGDFAHVPHATPVMSKPITVTVE